MDTTAMHACIKQANDAALQGEIPVGAVLVDTRTGQIVTQSHNLTEQMRDPTAHAEIIAIRARCAELGDARLPEHDLYVTLEPCPMCAAAISHARIRRVYFGAYDAKGGGTHLYADPTLMHKPEIYGGIEETKCASLLTDFFKTLRV